MKRGWQNDGWLEGGAGVEKEARGREGREGRSLKPSGNEPSARRSLGTALLG